MGHVNPGEEVIIFDPAYDVYRPQVQMAGGKTIGITLRPNKTVNMHLFSTQRLRYCKGYKKVILFPLSKMNGILTGTNFKQL